MSGKIEVTMLSKFPLILNNKMSKLLENTVQAKLIAKLEYRVCVYVCVKLNHQSCVCVPKSKNVSVNGLKQVILECSS